MGLARPAGVGPNAARQMGYRAETVPAYTVNQACGSSLPACRLLMPLIAFATLGLAVLGPFLIRLLYGDSFSASLTPFLYLLPGMAALSLVDVHLARDALRAFFQRAPD